MRYEASTPPPALTARRDLRRVPLSIDGSAHAENVGPGVRIGRSLVAQSSLICNATNGSRPAPEATDRLAIAFAAKQSRPSRRADAACSAGSDCPPPRHPSQVWAIATSPSDSCVWRLRDHEGDRATDSRAGACRRTGGRERLRAGPLRYECGPGGVHPGDSAEEATKRRGCQRRSDRQCRRCRATRGSVFQSSAADPSSDCRHLPAWELSGAGTIDSTFSCWAPRQRAILGRYAHRCPAQEWRRNWGTRSARRQAARRAPQS
jgi:hypothetical protein